MRHQSADVCRKRESSASLPARKAGLCVPITATDRFVEPRADTIGMIAFNGETPLGTVQAILLDETGAEAELAIVVARSARHAGVGTALIGALVARLRERGVGRVIACALRENRPLENLARRTGFHVDVADGPAWRFVLDLAPRTEPLPE